MGLIRSLVMSILAWRNTTRQIMSLEFRETCVYERQGAQKVKKCERSLKVSL